MGPGAGVLVQPKRRARVDRYSRLAWGVEALLIIETKTRLVDLQDTLSSMAEAAPGAWCGREGLRLAAATGRRD